MRGEPPQKPIIMRFAISCDGLCEQASDLTENAHTGAGKKRSLYWYLDEETKTAMGGRCCAPWIQKLVDLKSRFEERQDIIQVFMDRFERTFDRRKGSMTLNAASQVPFGKNQSTGSLAARDTLGHVPTIKVDSTGDW